MRRAPSPSFWHRLFLPLWTAVTWHRLFLPLWTAVTRDRIRPRVATGDGRLAGKILRRPTVFGRRVAALHPARFVVLLLFLVLSGCLNDPADRVEHDRRVGHAALDGVGRVDVDDGLATVRAFDAEGVTLWAQAPGIAGALAFEAPLPGAFRVTLRNALPDAVLTATADGTTIPVTALPDAGPTGRAWELSDLPADRPVRFTVAAPDAVTPAPFRVVYVSDLHHGRGPLASIIDLINADPAVRFVICGGDLTHRGTRSELEAFLADLATLRVPFFTAAGNHDVGWDTADVWAALIGRATFSFPFRGARFTFLDTADATVHPTAFSWLRGFLDAGRDALHVLVAHVPPLDPVGERNAGFSSRAQAHRLLAALAAARVDLTLYGHIHTYHAFTNAGIPAYLAGGGITEGERGDGVGPHFLTLDLDPAAATPPKVTLVRVP